MGGQKIIDGLTELLDKAKCKHEFEWLEERSGNGVAARCRKCELRFSAWPGSVHYEQIAALRPKLQQH